MSAVLGSVIVCLCLAGLAQATGSDAITLQFVNELKEPNFNFAISLYTNRAQTILELMEEAAWQDITFMYSIQYFGSVPGYMLNAVRKDLRQGGSIVPQPFVFSDVNWDQDHSYWSIKIDGTFIPVGISGYQPKHGDTVVFQLVQSSAAQAATCDPDDSSDQSSCP
ncbi:hypothetical protein BaRGS_00029793 [Batillaria attramentaria]|uniref:Transcobalamin-like C-terminal domain-containing protein n=1 Tax=Batillaria attramentaria TaxID=370345 RepID=A0ABD0JV14_9CAEN